MNKIISNTANTTGDNFTDVNVMFDGNMLEIFQLTSEVEVKEIIIKSPNKWCDLDPLPTWLLEKCADQLLPLITAIANRSVDESVMPLCLKRTIIAPLLKRSGLGKEEIKNYHSISSLPFSLAIIEVIQQKLHSWKCRSNITEALDEGSMIALIMLELST